MIWSIAWRNIWRSRTRSLIVIGAVIVAIWSLIFIMAFMRGITYDYIENAIKYQTSHMQVHNPSYLEDNLIQYTIPDATRLLARCDHTEEIEAVSPRIAVNSMISSPRGARGVQVRGVVTERERSVLAIASTTVEGEYLPGNTRNEIVVGTSLAEKLKVGIRKKVVVTFQAADGEIATAAFRIVGLFDTGNKQVDDLVAFVHYDDLRAVASLDENTYHELGIKLVNQDSVDAVAASLAAEFPDVQVQTYGEIAPELALFESQVNLNMYIMTIIIMLALIFGIINTMLMAVLERTREIGMLMAIGMRKWEIFKMIVIETFYVSVIGAPVGLLLGWITVSSLETNGIDLSFWSAGMSEFGMSAIVHPVLEADAYAFIAVSIIITALLASISPARKAVKLRPVEAMRKI